MISEFMRHDTLGRMLVIAVNNNFMSKCVILTLINSVSPTLRSLSPCL